MGRPRLTRTRIHDLWINMDYYHSNQQSDPNSDCINWTAGKHRQGYGMMGAWREDGSKIMTTTHRISARIHYDRPIDSSEYVVHTCSNMACCNPNHLIIGDRTDIHRVMRQNHRYRPGGLDYYQLRK